ncbi:MAG: toxin-antitoxin system TumE family protein [Candidatus Methylumidiphilus sp.]
MKAGDYLNEVKTRLATSLCVTLITVVAERVTRDRGYFRARLSLVNGDFLEVSEYFTIRAGKPETLEYRYQWMDSAQERLIRRWDNARHFPGLPNFPHHQHVGEDNQVKPSQTLSILGLIDLIELELGLIK